MYDKLEKLSFKSYILWLNLINFVSALYIME